MCWRKAIALSTATSFGQHLLGDQGYDPCLEDPASLWLLYGLLLKPPCLATAWDIAFKQFPRLEFSSDELLLAWNTNC